MWDDGKYEAKVKARFLAYLEEKPNGCLEPRTSKDDFGYGQMGGSFRKAHWVRKTHLLAWEWANGVVPPGYIVRHNCGNKACANLNHLEAVVDVDRAKRAFAAQKRPTRESDTERFMQYVDKRDTGCWIWIGSYYGAGGYGQFHMDGEKIQAHRASHVMFKGPIPEGHVIRHDCDDRACVNPQHLQSGTQKENMQDSRDRNRRPFGSAVGTAKLDEDKVAAMKGEFIDRPGEMTRLADKYRMAICTVSSIIHGETWKHVTTPLGSAPSGDAARPFLRGKITEAQVMEIRALRATGETLSSLAEAYGLSKNYVWQICNFRTWKHVGPAQEGK